MPITFRILPERGLVVVRFEGFVTIGEIRDASAGYVADKDFALGQKQLVNLSEITGYDIDYVDFMNLQAGKAERLALAGVQSLVVYIAPTPISQEIGAMFIRTWDGVDAVVPMVQESEARALSLLGQPEDSVAALFALADGAPLK